MHLVLKDGSFSVYRIADGDFSVCDENRELNHFSPEGVPLGKGQYMSAFQKTKSEELAKRAVQ